MRLQGSLAGQYLIIEIGGERGPGATTNSHRSVRIRLELDKLLAGFAECHPRRSAEIRHRLAAEMEWGPMPQQDDKTLESESLRSALCVFDRLAQEMRQGGATPIESCLAKVAVADQPAVLGLLISLELAARRTRGERPVENEYLKRFPRQAAIVRAAYSRFLSEGDATQVDQSTEAPFKNGRRSPEASLGLMNDFFGTSSDPQESDRPTLTHYPGLAANSNAGPAEACSRYSLAHFHKEGGLGEVWRARPSTRSRGRAQAAQRRMRRESGDPVTIPARGLDHRPASAPGNRARI